jgi:LysR family nitrogen assimilation transcriptional regulator
MNSDDLECFVRIASCGSFSKAAIELGIDHSTLSRNMSRLEVSAKVRLLHRSGRGVSLTEAGQALYERAREVLLRMEETRNFIQCFSDKGPARLVLAAQPTIARTVFGPLGRALKARYPGMQIRFVECMGAQIQQMLASGEVDIALFYIPKHTNGVDVDVLLCEHTSLASPSSHTHMGKTFPVAQLAQVPLILPSTPFGLRLLADSLAREAGIVLDVALECDGSTSLTKMLVQQGAGCTILPLAAVADEVAQGRLRASRLVAPEVVRQVGIATPKNRAPIVEHWQITQLIRNEVERVVEDGHWPDAWLARRDSMKPAAA